MTGSSALGGQLPLASIQSKAIRLIPAAQEKATRQLGEDVLAKPGSHQRFLQGHLPSLGPLLRWYAELALRFIPSTGYGERVLDALDALADRAMPTAG